MEDKNNWGSATKIAASVATGIAAILSIIEFVAGTGLMGEVYLPPAVYLILGVFLFVFVMSLNWAQIYKWIEGRMQARKFRLLFPKAKEEFDRTEGDQQIGGQPRTRNMQIFNRVSLARKLADLNIETPPVDDTQGWPEFAARLAALAEQGRMNEAKGLYEELKSHKKRRVPPVVAEPDDYPF